MFGGNISWGFACLFEERLDLTVDGVFVDHVFDGFGVVFEDGKETLLQEGLIDTIGIVDEVLEPSWEKYFIIFEVFDDMLNQNIT